MTNVGTSFWNRCKRAVACLVTLIMLLSHSMGVIAQGIPDIEAPLVELEFVDAALAGVAQVFTVQAFDDIGLGDVSLHHRRAGESAFIKSLMAPEGDTGFFKVEIKTDPGDLRSIEYYAQALDLNGNRTVSGFAFDPFVRDIIVATEQSFAPVTTTEATVDSDETESATTEVASTQNGTAADQPAPATISKRRWLYIALGVLAAGVVASQLGGGGDGGSSSDNTNDGDGDDPLVPLTVTIGDPIP